MDDVDATVVFLGCVLASGRRGVRFKVYFSTARLLATGSRAKNLLQPITQLTSKQTPSLDQLVDTRTTANAR